MNKQQQLKEQILNETAEFKNKLVYTTKFFDLDMYIGNKDTYDELQSPAACVLQEGLPFIYLVDSTILSTFRYNKKEVEMILFHELGHYKLGHLNMSHMLETELTEEIVRMNELDADAKAVELAVEKGLDMEDALVSMITGLVKSANKVMIDCLSINTLPSQRCMEFMQERVEALRVRLNDKDAFMDSTLKLRKQLAKAITKVANNKGYRHVDDLIDSIQNMDIDDFVNNIELSLSMQDEPVYEIDQSLLDRIAGMDTDGDISLSFDDILDDIWNN